MKNVKAQNTIEIDKKTLDDYWKFFTTEEGADMLPYVYMESSHLYDEMIKNEPAYYLFHDECDLIKNNKDQLIEILKDVTDIIEVGPGSCHTIEHKTLPILSYATNLKTYHALDHSENYLVDAIDFIKQNTKDIEIKAVEADLLDPQDITVERHVF